MPHTFRRHGLAGLGAVILVSLAAGLGLGALLTPEDVLPKGTSWLTTTPRVITVTATLGWQPAGISVHGGDTLRVEQTGGAWTEQVGGVAAHDGASLARGYICTRVMPAEACQEPIPTAPQGALIIRAGEQPLLVGTRLTYTMPRSGPLAFRINDPDGGLYDNGGVLTLTVRLVR